MWLTYEQRFSKCDYVRLAAGDDVLAGACPVSGIAYRKWVAAQQSKPSPSQPQHERSIDSGFSCEPCVPQPPWPKRLLVTLTEVPEQVDSLSFWGRALLYGLFLLWGSSFIVGGIDWPSIGGSFLHNANLPFHEFGHVLFSLLGRFMSILGGSLFQVLMPLGLMLVFTIQRRDNFAASIMLWWSGQNFIDISPYIADAPYRVIPASTVCSEIKKAGHCCRGCSAFFFACISKCWRPTVLGLSVSG
ncbi:MAG: hypothetical protein V7629_15315 [Motiliproteus sp.]